MSKEKKLVAEETDKAEQLTLEEAFERLEQTIGKMEDPQMSLADSFERYKAGIELVKYCNEQIDRIEKEVQVLAAEGETDEF